MTKDLSTHYLLFSKIQHNQLIQNGKVIFEMDKQVSFHNFAKNLYKHLDLRYPKFHKMDHLSKLGFLCFENLANQIPDFESITKNKFGLFLATRHSSLDTDAKYYATFLEKNSPPSPSLFVYTLPNIVLGEICIRHKIKGEQACFVSEQFDSNFICNYANLLIAEERIQAAAIGWLDFHENNAEAILFFIK